MMEGVATRRFAANGKIYKAGSKVAVPANQLRDFEIAGLVKLSAGPPPEKKPAK